MSESASCCVEQTLILPSKGKNLALMRHFATDFVTKCGYSDDDVFDITIAVGEACANALEHGSPLKEENNISVTCSCMKDHMLIKVKDEGVFKNGDSLNALSDDNHASGRGMLLMLAVMDKVTVDESSDGTTVSLTKKHKIDPNRIRERTIRAEG